MNKPRRHQPKLLAVAATSLALIGTLSTISYATSFEEWKRQQQKDFQDYLTAEQQAFNNMLRTRWKLEPQQQGEIRDKAPKPVKPPKIKNPEAPKKPIVKTVTEIPAQPKPQPKAQPEPQAKPEPKAPQVVTAPVKKAPVEKKPAPAVKPEPAAPKEPIISKAPEKKPVAPKISPKPKPAPKVVPVVAAKPKGEHLRFYGHDLYFSKTKIKEISARKLDNNSIADYWVYLVKATKNIAPEMKRYQKELALSDWASYELTQAYAKSKVKKASSQQLISWALMMDLGYDARVAYKGNDLSVLLPMQQKVYFWDFVNRDGKRYYMPKKLKNKEFYVYTGDNLGKSLSLDLSFDKTVLANEEAKRSMVTLKNKFSADELMFSFNNEHAQYYRNHPAIALDWYFKADIEDSAKNSIKEALIPVLNGMSELEKVSYLLALVQHGYAYETDQNQWGREYYVAPEQMLGLAAADCEDRSFLFAWLVKELVGNDFIGLLYPGHVAVAVEMKNIPTNSDTVSYKGKTYVVADPTYIGAPVGKAMPEFINAKPEVIAI